MSTYFPSIDATDMQEAALTVFDENISEDMAQDVLDNYIDTTSITAQSGCTREDENTAIQSGLVQQLSANQEEIKKYIDELFNDW